MKICVVCHESKDLNEFPKSGKTTRTKCKICYNLFQKEYRKNNPEAYESIKKSWSDASKRYAAQKPNSENKRFRKYGITRNEYEAMFDKQNSLCAICKRDRALVIDHCHATNIVRGLLCNPCNLILGYAEDRVDVLQSSVLYLQS